LSRTIYALVIAAGAIRMAAPFAPHRLWALLWRRGSVLAASLIFGARAMKKVPAKNLQLKRAYDKPAAADGTRVLVDRLWPRGVKKSEAAIALWARDLAPSTDLRKWFGHDPERWSEFKSRYTAELCQHGELLEHLRRLARRGPVTLIYAARDQEHNEAVIIRDIVLRR
jgi:uncharacterized protein YeaO (DUF488 family)